MLEMFKLLGYVVKYVNSWTFKDVFRCALAVLMKFKELFVDEFSGM